jgi:hypothetical protein
MKNIYSVTSLIFFLAGLALAVTAAIAFPDAGSQAIKNAWGLISLIIFVIALGLGVIAGVVKKD